MSLTAQISIVRTALFKQLIYENLCRTRRRPTGHTRRSWSGSFILFLASGSTVRDITTEE